MQIDLTYQRVFLPNGDYLNIPLETWLKHKHELPEDWKVEAFYTGQTININKQ